MHPEYEFLKPAFLHCEKQNADSRDYAPKFGVFKSELFHGKETKKDTFKPLGTG
jgi:hypothetical protein